MPKAYKCDRCGEYHELDYHFRLLVERISRNLNDNENDDITIHTYRDIYICPRCMARAGLTPTIEGEARAMADSQHHMEENEVKKEETTHETQHD